jgi:O-antigen/teichoic acid export membrane protein
VARHAAAYATGSVVGGVTRAVLLPVIARTLTPEEYGVLSLLLAATNLLHLLFEAGLTQSLIRFHHATDDAAERRRVRGAAFLFLPILDLAMAVPVLAARGLASGVLFGTSAHGGLVALAVLTAASAAQFQLFLAHLRADDRSRDFALFMAAKGAVSLAVTFALVFGADLGVPGFLIGNLAGPLVIAAVAVPRLIARSGTSFAEAKLRLRRLLDFGVPLVPASLGLWALSHLDAWLLRVLANLSAVGVYGFATEICLPIGLLMTSIQLAWPSFAFARARREEGAAEIARVFRHLFIVLVGGATAVAALRHEALAVLGTEIYARSASIIPPLALSTCIYGAAQGFATGMQVAGDTRRMPLFVLGAVAVNAALNLLVIPPWREAGAAWATVATNVVLAGAVLRESHRQFRIPFEVGRALRVLAAGAVVVLAADACGGLPFAATVVARVVVLALFPAALVVLGALSRQELRALPSLARAVVTRGAA